MINSFAEIEDFDEETIENIVENHLINTIISYFKDKKDFNQIYFLEKFDNFPSEYDLKFIKEAELPQVLDYCYPLLEQFIKENEDNNECITSDTIIVLDILNDMSKRNIPKEFAAGMLYYLIKHRYG